MSFYCNRISLYTDNFLEKEIIFLQDLFQKTINVSFKITRKNSMKNKDKGFYLYLDKQESVSRFVSYIKDMMPISMNRKSDRWKGLV